jgi:hypothetical protein
VPRRGAVGAACALVTALLAACSSGSADDRVPARPVPCPVTESTRTDCGVLLGITTEQPTTRAVEQAESEARRKFDVVYRFHDINDAIPTADEREVVAQGRLLHVSIDARLFAGPRVQWSAVAAGKYDAELRRQGRGIASLRSPVFMTFEHEADQPDKQIQGTGPEFVAAWRHVRDVYRAAGATNAVWVWIMMGTADSLGRAAKLWPGNDVVDWIGWNVYNASGCRLGDVDPARYMSFADSATIFYRWLTRNRLSLGIDTTKPMMISETGSVLYPDAARTAAWYTSIPKALRKMPQIKAVSLFDHTGNSVCDYRVSRSSATQEAVSRMAADALFAGHLEHQ